MLKSNKFLLGLVTALGISSTGFNASAEIVDTLEFGTSFYLLESIQSDSSNSYTLYEYNMATAQTSVSPVIELSLAPTAFGFDGNDFYIAVNDQLIEYDKVTGAERFIRNLFAGAKDVIAAGNYLIILLGVPNNEIIIVDKLSGALIDRTPELPADEMFPIQGIYYDAADNRVIAQLESEGDNPDGSQYMAATFDSGTGALGDLTTIPVEGPYEAPKGMSKPFFLDNLQMAMDSSGNVVEFSDADIIFAHGDLNTVSARRHFITPSFNFSTDSVIDHATDDGTYAYFSLTLDNECNTNAPPGGSRIARWAKTANYLQPNWNGFLEPTTDYYDTANAIHTLASNGINIFLFYGEGSDLTVEIIGDSDFTYPFHPWRNASYSPSQANMSNIRQSTSFTLKDNQTLAMQIEDGCDHYVGFWDTTSNSFVGHTETNWFDAIDGAYVPDLDRFFVAFTDGTNSWIRNLSTVSYESDDPAQLATSWGFGTGSIHQLIGSNRYLIVNYTTSAGAKTIRSYRLAADSDDITGIGAVNLDPSQGSSETEASLASCCDSWTSAIYSAANNRIYFTTSTGLFAIGFDDNDGTFSGPDGGAALQSIDYSSTHDISSANPFMTLVGDAETHLLVDGQLYDVTDLRRVDNINRPVDIGLYLNNSIFSFDLETSTYYTTTFTIGAESFIGAPDEGTDVTGTLAALLPISSGGGLVPLTLSTNNGQLVVTTNGTQTATTGSSGGSGGGDDDDTGGDDGGDSGNDGGCNVTNQCVQAPGGGGGGPVDILLMLGLAGLGMRQLRKPH